MTKLNGFNNGRDTTEGIGGKPEPFEKTNQMTQSLRQRLLESIQDSLTTTIELFNPKMFKEIQQAAEKCEAIVEDVAIEFAKSLAYNYDYKEDGKWTRKEWDDEPIVDVAEHTTKELFTLFKKEKGI